MGVLGRGCWERIGEVVEGKSVLEVKKRVMDDERSWCSTY
jgi:hypothetical protein